MPLPNRLQSLALAVFALATSDAHAAYVYGPNGHAYEFVEDRVQWLDAFTLAPLRTAPDGYGPGHLATFSDKAEADFISFTFPIHAIEIGFTDQAVEGEWRWIDGTPGIWQDPTRFANPIQTAYVKWAPGEPNGGVTENYGYFNWDVPGQFNDGKGIGGDPFPYLVEYDPLPNPVPAPEGLTLLLSALATCPLCFMRNTRRSQ